ncbi:NRSN2 protein, partial [Aramus guarauna]|nr:NRSN2 protein [Aramus guarauna]
MPARQPDCSCVRGPRVVQGKWYGVRSYLHLFYEDCTGASPDGDRSLPHGAQAPLIWKVRDTENPSSSLSLERHPSAHILRGGRGLGQEGAELCRAQVFFSIQKSVTLQPTSDFQVCSPWARHRWLWAQHSNSGGAGSFPDMSFHQTSPLPAREGCGDREGSSAGFKGKSAVQTWVPTP